MAGLPSYDEATARPDWLVLVAPYVRFGDYWRLSLVNRHFWRTFAPRLWENPLKAVRLAGLDPSDDVRWWFEFVFNKLSTVRPAVRFLVRVLDATGFAKESYNFASDRHDQSMQLSFAKALELLPNTECILLDGHTDLDLRFLVVARSADSQHPPLLLSIPDCPFELPGNFFASPRLSRLVYLDLSAIPGSVRSILRSGLLPDLRILKLRNRELDDASFTSLVQLYGTRLWSLDISSNRITDQVVHVVRDTCFAKTTLRNGGYFYTEGQLVDLEGGTDDFGPFVELRESQWSQCYNHPERYFTDPPAYLADEQSGVQEYHVFRADGKERVREDSAEDIVAWLSRQEYHLSSPVAPATQGLTHLHLSNNLLSAAGLVKLLRTSNGQLEYFACDSMPLLRSYQTQRHWPIASNMIGIVGAADIFRPVFSSNLRVLRIHHSLVTGILDLTLEGFSSLARIHMAERTILPRIQSLFRGVFVPDLNPRLTSLTLTHVPRRSSGPLISSLLNFLRLLSEQERAIQDVGSSAKISRRAPTLLKGLRHLRLEFEPDPMEEGLSATEDFDAENLLSSGDQGFSFFQGEQYEKSPVLVRHGEGSRQVENDDLKAVDATEDETIPGPDFITYEGEWEGKSFSCQVWQGPSNPLPNSALCEYGRLVRIHRVHDGVGPASPSQIRAGAPTGSYIFHTAWMLAIMPLDLNAPPKRELEAMTDVLDILKKYRLEGRTRFASLKRSATPGFQQVKLGEPHFFWTGKLEVSTEQSLTQGRTSHHWR
ncbi:hypothetical protein NLU13_6216 [Sarocladium strictum]|uniref:Uncharacterized protein n=1 Tax=Sarocladium strictum TaxID=5046 RepID=A0AA39GH19_SARSR|nr:hypothetical protein NLU13_6216 [Sarocladium strictum]